MRPAVFCRTSPSLALLKYWGKQDSSLNIPATPSVAVTLSGLSTATRVRVLDPHEGSDTVRVNGALQPPVRYERFFANLREMLKEEVYFEAESTNNFPTAAGIASSSSGFAALALACSRAAGGELSDRELSSAARIGSASAARAVFGGFTLLNSGALWARQLHDESYWPELRVIVCVVEAGAKKHSSRVAMETTRESSPYYRRWVRLSARALPSVIRALDHRDIEELGDAARLSYLRMFATIISTSPPTLYWLPESVEIINECDSMRNEGIGVWETMDAGPQVKLLCLQNQVDTVKERIDALRAVSKMIVCPVGGPPDCRVEGSGE